MMEIIIAVLAVFGGYTILTMIKSSLLYPKRVRRKIMAAVFYDGEYPSEAAAYARYLRLCGKISSERLIILVKDDIIESGGEAGLPGEVHRIGD